MKVRITREEGNSQYKTKDYIGQICEVVQERNGLSSYTEDIMIVRASDNKLLYPWHFNHKNAECELVKEYTIKDYINRKTAVMLYNVEEETQLENVSNELNYKVSTFGGTFNFPYQRMFGNS